MTRPISTAGLAATLERESGTAWFYLLTITHADLAQPIRVVDNTQDITSRSNTFVGCPFRVHMPQERDDKPPEATLEIDNVDRAIVQAIRSISTSPTITLEVVSSLDYDTVEAGPFNFTLENAAFDATTVSGRLTFEKILSLSYPALTFTPTRFPGLF